MACVLLSLLRLKHLLFGKAEKKEESRAAEKDILRAAAAAHFSQFYFNIYSFLQHVSGNQQELPFVFSKEMMFIFRTDFAMACLNYFVSRRI